MNGNQLDFFNETEMCNDAGAPEPGKTTPVKVHARKAKRTKEDLTEGLEYRKVLCELTEEEQICETCGSKLVRVGEKFVRSEWVIVPAQRSIWWTIMRPATSTPIAKQKPVQHPSGRQ